MPEQIYQEVDFEFEPGLNLFRIIQKKIRKLLAGLLFLFLILFGLYGLLNFYYYLISPIDQGREFLDVFYLTLLSDMFLFYLFKRQDEKTKKIRPPRPNEKVEISLYLDKTAKISLERAWFYAYRKRYRSLKPIHIFAAFLKEKEFKKILKRLNCPYDRLIAKTKKILESASMFPESEKEEWISGLQMGIDFKRIFTAAYLFSLGKNKEEISSLDLLWALSQQKNLVGMIFDEFGVSPEEIERVISWAQLEEKIKKWEKEFFWRRLFKPKGKLNRTMTAVTTPVLDRVSQDLTYLARKGQFEMAIGREKEVEEIFQHFNTGQVGVLLVGKDGVGKKTILKRIAQLMVEEKVPKFLQDKRLVKLDLANLVSLEDDSNKGERYLEKILVEVNRAGNIILVIENIENLVGLRSQPAGLDFSEILAPALENQAFYFIATTNPAGYSSRIEGRNLSRVLERIEVGLPSKDLLWQIIISKVYILEKKLKVFFSADAVEESIDLAERYIYGQALPTKAMSLLKEASYAVRAQRGSGSFITKADLVELVSQKTKIPLGQVEETDKEKLLNMEKLIHKRMIGQKEAVEQVSRALRRSRIDPKKRQRPIANFLFFGPTGVGKTELAKTLAEVFFGSEKKMIRLDMSEYQEKRGLRRLIGLRSEEGNLRGFLTEAVKRQPYSLLLLDEIEKAHPDILNLFLQVMDDGRLTDAGGETINFTNIILIATSNAAARFIQGAIKEGKSYEEIYKQAKEKALSWYFRPEFLNRFDSVILFKSLSMEDMISISRLFVQEVRGKIKERGINLEAEEGAIKQLAQAGYDPLYGARPLKRLVQERVENEIARLILEDKIKRRDKIVLKDGLKLEIKKAPEI